MPSFTNIGGYVDSGTMVDTWATVGSCAQVGRNVHLSGGVGLGGVLEPPQRRPGGHRGRRVHRLALHGGRGGAGAPRREARRRLDPHRLDPRVRRRDRRRAPARRGAERAVAVGPHRVRSFPGGEFGMPCLLVLRRLARGRDPRQDRAQRRAARSTASAPERRSPTVTAPAPLDLTGRAWPLTAALVDVPSVSGDEAPLADAVEAACGRCPHLTCSGTATRSSPAPTWAARSGSSSPATSTPCRSPTTSRPASTDGPALRLRHLRHEVRRRRPARGSRPALPDRSPTYDLTLVFYDCEEVEAARNGLRRRRRGDPGLARRRLRGAVEPTRRRDRGRLPGHLRAEVTAHGRRARTAPARGWAATPSTRPAGSSTAAPPTTPREPEVDGCATTRG